MLRGKGYAVFRLVTDSTVSSDALRLDKQNRFLDLLGDSVVRN